MEPDNIMKEENNNSIITPENLDTDEQRIAKPKGKRNRVPLSCEFCRKRKAKCDRQRPYCSTCERIGRKDECVYSKSAWKHLEPKGFSNKSPKDVANKNIEKEKLNDINQNVLVPQISNYPNIPTPLSFKNVPSTPINVPASGFAFLPPLQSKVLNQEYVKLPNLTPQKQMVEKREVEMLLRKFKESNPVSPHVSPFSSQLFEDPVRTPSFSIDEYNKFSNNSATASTEMNEQTRLSNLYNCIKVKENDTIDFYHGFISMMYKYEKITNYGPLAWMSLVMKNPYGRPIREELMKYKDSMIFSDKRDDDNYANRMRTTMGFDDIKKIDLMVSLDDKITPAAETTNIAKDHDGFDIKTNFNISGSSINDSYLLHQILKILPCKKVIWILIDRFFSHVYPLFPYLDQFYFIFDVETILKQSKYINPESEERIKSLKVTKKLDFAILGKLLMVLKLAEDSYNGCLEEERDLEYEYIQNHKLSENMVAVAESCLGKFKLLKKCALPVFQLALLLREYGFSNGSTDVSNPESQIFISLLIQLGTSIGLNREPSKMDLALSKGRMGNLWRKIWYGLVSMDTKQFILFGTGRAVNEDLYDTQLPMFDVTSSNVDDMEMEREVIEKMKLNHKFDQANIKLANYVCSFNTKSKIKVIMDQLIELEQMVEEHFGSLNDILRKEASTHSKKITKFWDVSIYVQTLGLINCVYSHLFIHFEKIKNFKAAKFARFKCIYTWTNIYANLEAMTIESAKYIGPGLTVTLSHIVLPIIHKGWIGISSTYVGAFLTLDKLKDMKHTCKKYQLIMTMINNVSSNGQKYLAVLKKLSGQCFFAWKLMKAHSFIMELIRNKRFIFKSLSHLYNIIDDMNEADCLNLIEILDIENYRLGSKGSALFLFLKDRIVNNKIDQEIDLDLYSHNSNYISDEVMRDIDEISKTRAPLDAYTKSGELDDFWRNVFAQKQSPALPVVSTEETSAKGPEESVTGDVSESILNLASNNLNSFDNTDLFVNRAIFDMFN